MEAAATWSPLTLGFCTGGAQSEIGDKFTASFWHHLTTTVLLTKKKFGKYKEGAGGNCVVLRNDNREKKKMKEKKPCLKHLLSRTLFQSLAECGTETQACPAWDA